MNKTRPGFPPDVFEAVVNSLAEALVTEYRSQWNAVSPHNTSAGTSLHTGSQWLTVKEAASRARCSVKILYRAVSAGRLRAARIGVGRNMRFRSEWVDECLQNAADIPRDSLA